MLKTGRWVLGASVVGAVIVWSVVGLLRPLWTLREAGHPSHGGRPVAGGHGIFTGPRQLVASDDPLPEDVRAWQGTEVDGALEAQADGHLALSPDVRRTFDYFLLATGELPLTSIDALFKQHVASRLREPAAGEARSLWQRYVQCRDTMMDVDADGADGLRQRLRLVRALQEHYFSHAELAALFAEDNADDVIAVEQLELLADETVTDEERFARLRAWLDTLPEERRQAREDSLRAISR